MTKKDIVYALSSGGKQSFITMTQVAQKMGCSERTVRRRLEGVNAIDGKYFFVPEVAENFSKRLGV